MFFLADKPMIILFALIKINLSDYNIVFLQGSTFYYGHLNLAIIF